MQSCSCCFCWHSCWVRQDGGKLLLCRWKKSCEACGGGGGAGDLGQLASSCLARDWLSIQTSVQIGTLCQQTTERYSYHTSLASCVLPPWFKHAYWAKPTIKPARSTILQAVALFNRCVRRRTVVWTRKSRHIIRLFSSGFLRMLFVLLCFWRIDPHQTLVSNKYIIFNDLARIISFSNHSCILTETIKYIDLNFNSY